MIHCPHCDQPYDGVDSMCAPCTQIAYCSVEGCHRRATGERLVGVHDPRPLQKFGVSEDDLVKVVELVCERHEAQHFLLGVFDEMREKLIQQYGLHPDTGVQHPGYHLAWDPLASIAKDRKRFEEERRA